MSSPDKNIYPDSKSPGSIPGGVGAAPNGPVVQGTGVGFPQARSRPRHPDFYAMHGITDPASAPASDYQQTRDALTAALTMCSLTLGRLHRGETGAAITGLVAASERFKRWADSLETDES